MLQMGAVVAQIAFIGLGEDGVQPCEEGGAVSGEAALDIKGVGSAGGTEKGGEGQVLDEGAQLFQLFELGLFRPVSGLHLAVQIGVGVESEHGGA